MKKEKKELLLQAGKQLNVGSVVCGLGFLLHLAAAAMELNVIKDILAVIFGIFSLWVFISAAAGRRKDKDSVSYNQLWGTGALALLLGGSAVLTVRFWLGM